MDQMVQCVHQSLSHKVTSKTEIAGLGILEVFRISDLVTY